MGHYKGIHGEAPFSISVEFSIRKSGTYFARVANEGLKSSKLGLLALLWTGDPDMRRLKASSFNMALLAVHAV